MGGPADTDWIASPGGWVPPDDGSSPGWDWIPMVDGYGIVPHPERMPLYVQLMYRLPWLGRRAHVRMWHDGGFDVLPPPT